MSASTILFVCRDCSRRSDDPDIRKYLKRRLKDDGLKKDVRVVRTECMGLCPGDGRVSICEPRSEPSAIWPEADREEIYQRLVDLVEARE